MIAGLEQLTLHDFNFKDLAYTMRILDDRNRTSTDNAYTRLNTPLIWQRCKYMCVKFYDSCGHSKITKAVC